MLKIAKVILVASLLLASAGCDMFSKSEQEYIQSAIKNIQNDNPSAASIELKKALKINPNNPESRILLGSQLLKLNNLDGASAQFEKAESLGYNKNNLNLPRAKIYLYQKKYKELIENTSIPEQLDKADKSEIAALIGEAYLYLNDTQHAKEYFTRARTFDPESIAACLAPVKLELAEKKLKQAKNSVIACTKQFPSSAECWYLKGLIDKYNGQVAEAKQSFKRAIDIESGNYVSRVKLVSAVELAHIQIVQGSTVEAEKTLRIIASQYRHPVIPYVKAINRYQEKEYDNALKYLDQSLKLNEKYIPALSLMAIINQERGDIAQSKYYIDLVRRISGNTKNIETVKRYLDYQITSESDYASTTLESNQDKELVRIFQQQDSNKAIEELEDVLDKDKGNLKANVLLAFSYLRAGKQQSAIDQIHTVVSQHEDSPLAHSAMGVIYVASGDLPAAENSFQKALKIDPAYKPALLNLARLKLKSNQIKQAQVYVDKVLSIDSQNQQAILLKVYILSQSGKNEASIKLLEEYAKNNPRARMAGLLVAQHYLNTGDLVNAEKQAQILVSQDKKNRVAAIILGRVKYRQGKLVEAGDIFNELQSNQTNDYVASYYLGKIARQNGDIKSAIAHLKKAVDNNRKFYLAMAELANIYTQAKNYPEAARIAQELISTNPEMPLGYILDGDNYVAQKKYKNASINYQKALIKKPENGLIAIKIFNVDRKLYGDKKAQNALKEWLTKHENAAARVVLASSYQQSGNYNSALKNYKAVINIQPNNVVALNNIAWIYYTKGKMNLAVNYAKRAQSLAPQRPEINDTLGWILVADGKYKQALVYLDSASAQLPGNPSIQYHRAYTLYRLGNKTDAKKILQELVSGKLQFDERKEAQKLLNKI
jgi:cellulose synthase operon protein C